MPEPEVDIDFLQKDMRELERLQEILQEAQDREVLLAEINEKIVEAKARLSKVKVNEILVAFANYQGNVEGQQEKKRLVLQWTESISVLSDKLTDLSDKEKKATDLLYEARKAAENNTDNREMLSLEQENKDNEAEREKLVNEAAVFSELLSKLSKLQQELNDIGFSCNMELDALGQNIAEEEKISVLKAATEIMNGLEELIKNHDAEVRTEISSLSRKQRNLKIE